MRAVITIEMDVLPGIEMAGEDEDAEELLTDAEHAFFNTACDWGTVITMSAQYQGAVVAADLTVFDQDAVAA